MKDVKQKVMREFREIIIAAIVAVGSVAFLYGIIRLIIAVYYWFN